jgi:hypothetical protein
MKIVIIKTGYKRQLNTFHPAKTRREIMDWLKNTPFLTTKERGFIIVD